MQTKISVLRQITGLLFLSLGLFAQQAPTGNPPPPKERAQGGASDLASQIDQLRPNYILRPGDQILLRAFEMEEISERPFRLDAEGFIDLPVLGRVKAGGLTVERFEATMVELLRKYVRMPQVTVSVVQFSSDPVFFVGAFKAPGIYNLNGQRTLVDMMVTVGGLQPTASRRIKITRRNENGDLPLPGSVTTPDGTAKSVEINIAALQNNLNPGEDIVLQPGDIVSVDKAESIYVTGEVGHTGAFDLQDRQSMSVIQALTMAGGLNASADPKGVRILRPIQNTSRRAEISLDLTRIMKGQDTDKPLMANDVLFVPKTHSLFNKNTIMVVLPFIMTGISLGILATH